MFSLFVRAVLVTFTGKKGAAMYLLSFFATGEASVTLQQSANSDYLLGILQWHIGAASLHCARPCTNKNQKVPAPKILQSAYLLCVSQEHVQALIKNGRYLVVGAVHPYNKETVPAPESNVNLGEGRVRVGKLST